MMGNHHESHNAKSLLLFTLHLMGLSSLCSISALPTDHMIAFSKGRVSVYDERGIALNMPSHGIRKTLRVRSIVNPTLSDNGFVPERMLGLANPALADGAGGVVKAISHTHLSGGEIFGIATGVIAGVGLLAYLVRCVWKRSRR